MKKVLGLSAALILVLALMWWLGRDSTVQVDPQYLPWHIELQGEGRSRVLGVDLHRSTVREASTHWGASPEIGLFVAPDGSGTLEAYYGRVRLGVFEARIVARLDTSALDMEGLIAHPVSDKPMPSGARKLELSEADLSKAYDQPIAQLTYIPSAQFDAAIVTRRFGKADEIVTENEERAYWLYPARGLAIFLDQDGKDAFHYVAPRDFAALRAEIEAGRASHNP